MKTRRLTFDQWPPKIQAQWTDETRPGSFVDDPGRINRWAASTLQVTAAELGLFLAEQSRTGWNTATLTTLVTRTSVEQWFEVLQKTRNTRGQASALGKLLTLCSALHPDHDWTFLTRRVRFLEKTAAAPRKLDRMVSSKDLLALGLKLMQGAHERPEREQAVYFRDGLIIALLASRPVRRRNLAGIEIGRQLIHQNGHWHLIFSGSETKNRRPIEVPWPTQLERYLDIYLEKYRPRFPGADRHQGLWAGYKSQALTSCGIYTRICIQTKEAFGHSVNPHLFRDCAATTLVIERPENAMAAKSLLGHAKLETTEKHYLHAQTLGAARQYQELLKKYQ